MSNDPNADERAYWLAKLGIVDDPSLSLADLRNRTAGAVHVNRSAIAAGGGIVYLTQAEADARYSQLVNAIPLSSATPIKSAKNGVVGTEGAASHGDHVHPVPALLPTMLYNTAAKVSALRSGGNTQFNTLNRLYAYPYPLFSNDFRDFTINGASVRCNTLAAASNARLGLYKSLASGLIDWTQLLFDVSVATTATGDCTATFSNIVVPCGLYWAAVVQQGAVATLDATTSIIPIYNPDDGSARTPNAIGVTGVTGALPTSTPSIGAANESPANLFLSLA